jgi:predicted O-methyltransferase YrrM
MSLWQRLLGATRSGRRRHVFLDYGYRPRERDWSRARGVNMLTRKAYEQADEYRALLARFAGQRAWLEKIPARAGDDDPAPRWINGSFPALDAVSLYGLLALHDPSIYVEVGSGNSTKFARRAVQDHGLRTRIVSIDPQPRREVDAICDEVIRRPCEDVDMGFFADLPGDTLLFVDNSHRSFQNSDVTVFFMEILPVLAPGTIWGLHDIFFPLDYPEAWSGRFFNEQYLLMSYLMGGGGADRILLPNGLISSSPSLRPSALAIFEAPSFDGIEKHGGCFWMQRT